MAAVACKQDSFEDIALSVIVCPPPAYADPVLDRMSRDGQNVVPGLGRQIAVADEPVRDTGRTGIVGGGGQSKIAETLLEVGEKFGGFRIASLGIERIGKATLVSRSSASVRQEILAPPAGLDRAWIEELLPAISAVSGT